MKRTVLICVAASALVLGACAPRVLTTGASPQTSIFVVQGNSGASYIVVDQDPIVLTKRGRYNITWRIETPGYTFDPTNGIRVIKTHRGISGQITNCQEVPKSEGREFGCDNNNNGKGVHEYTITLLDRNKAPLKGDPWVVND